MVINKLHCIHLLETIIPNYNILKKTIPNYNTFLAIIIPKHNTIWKK